MTQGDSSRRTSNGKPLLAAGTRRSIWRAGLMGALCAMGLLILAALSTYVYFRLEMAVGMPILLFGVSLAIAGRGNRWLWSLIFPVLSCAMGGAILIVYKLMPKEAEFVMSLLGFVLVSVVPGAVLWLAATLNRARASKGP